MRRCRARCDGLMRTISSKQRLDYEYDVRPSIASSTRPQSQRYDEVLRYQKAVICHGHIWLFDAPGADSERERRGQSLLRALEELVSFISNAASLPRLATSMAIAQNRYNEVI